MTTRAKVYVESVKLTGGVEPQEEVQFRAVYSDKKNAAGENGSNDCAR